MMSWQRAKRIRQTAYFMEILSWRTPTGEERRKVCCQATGQGACTVEQDACADSCISCAERFAPRFLAAMTPTRLTVFGDPSEEARQVLAGLSPTYLGFLGGFTAR